MESRFRRVRRTPGEISIRRFRTHATKKIYQPQIFGFGFGIESLHGIYIPTLIVFLPPWRQRPLQTCSPNP